MYQVSLFNNLLSSLPRQVTLDEIFHYIRTDNQLLQMTLTHREGTKQKQKVPAFVPSAIMRGGRKQENIQSLTGLLYFDIDHVNPDDMLSLCMALDAWTYVLGYYCTLSGQGLHILVRYEVRYYDMQPMPLSVLDFHTPDKAQQTHFLWNAIWEDVRRQFEGFLNSLMPGRFHVDTQCKDAARMSAMSYDAFARLFDDSHPFTVILSKAVLDYNESKPHRTSGNPVGRPMLTDVKRAFDAAEELAKSHGLEAKHGSLNKFVSTVIYEVNRYGIGQEEALSEAKQRYFYYGDGTRGISSIVRNIYKNKIAEHATLRLPGARRRQGGSPRRANLADIEAFLLTQGTYRKNVILHCIEAKWLEGSQMLVFHERNAAAFSMVDVLAQTTAPFHEVGDSDLATLVRLMYDQTGLTTTTADVYHVLQSDTCSAPYNPFIAYLMPLRNQWKPGDKDYLQDLIQTVEVEGGDDVRAMLDDFFVRWMVGMVHGWIHSSSTHGTILTLIGPQGIGKSSWMRMLMPLELRSYYKEQMRFRNLEKDDRIQLAQCGLINLEEIDALNEAETSQLKAIVTLDRIRERLPYDKIPRTLPRIATFCATGNRSDFLTDPTGNRRWLAFTVRRFTINPFDYQPDYEHIYAQALYYALHEPKRFVMSQDDISHLEHHNEDYQSQSMEVELCSTYVHFPKFTADRHLIEGSKWYTASEIHKRLSYYHPTAKLSIRTIAICLRKQGYQIRIKDGIRRYLVSLD